MKINSSSRLLAFVTIGLQIAHFIHGGEQGVITICDLFKDLRSYKGKFTIVRGQIRVSRHSFALGEDGCTASFTEGGKQWGTVINLVPAGSKALETPISFSVNEEARRKMMKILCFLHEITPQELGVEITATFEGELQIHDPHTLESYSTNLSLSRFEYLTGYGDMGIFPAQLVYKNVKDIVVKQKPQ